MATQNLQLEGRHVGRALALARTFFLRPNALPVLLLFLVPAATAQTAQKNVLILSGGRGRVSINQMESSLRSHFRGPVNFSVVDLENPRFEQKAYQDNLAEAIRAGYSSEKPDLIVSVMTAPFLFAVQYRDKMFPGTPIVFMSISDRLPEKLSGVTGVTSPNGISQTIDLALRLQPDTEAVAVIGDVSWGDKFWLAAEHAELLRHREKVREIDILGPASPQTLQKAAQLPPHTVVLYQLYPRDANQPAFGPSDVLAAIAPRLPIYTILPPFVGHGAIASVSYDPATDAILAGQLAARVLSGERPDDIPVVQNPDVDTSVDWRQLRRWNISESALPAGTRVLYREPTLWEQGRKYFLAGITVIVIQALLIFGLFWHRARRRKAEIELGKSEEKFSKAFRHGPLAITIATLGDGRYIEVNDTFEEQTGWKRDEVIGHTPIEIGLWIDPGQRTAFMKQMLAMGNVRDLEVPFRRKDGQIRMTLKSAEKIEVNGEPCVLSVIADITDRKQAEEASAGFGRKLIEAQETERTRIARELHDDINQRLAMVAISLKRAKEGLPPEGKTSRILEEAGGKISELESDVQALSHQLHSSKLEYLGLEVAARGFCRELSERQNVKVNLHCDGIPEDLSAEVSLCLFRVLQEALHNALKYSKVNEFDVSFAGLSGAIELRVHDSGAGFDLKRTSNGHGLGLTSMRERLRLINGKLSLDSAPGQGTTVLAHVPLDIGAATAGHAA